MRRTALAVVVVIVLAASAAHAHHGYANFFMDRTVTIEGEIEEVRFVNPHVVLKIRAADSTVYTALWMSASWFKDSAYIFARYAAKDDPRNKRLSYIVTSSTLKVGDHIVVIGSPPRDPASHEVVSLKEVRRPRDAWIWKRFSDPTN